MAVDRFFDWSQMQSDTGACIRPGGIILTKRAVEACGLPPDAFIGDVGCGAGGTLEYLERTGNYRLFGLDHSQIMLGEVASRLASNRLVRGSIEELPFKPFSFDALFCECVLSTLDDRESALRGLAELLKVGGVLILSDLHYRKGGGQEASGIGTKDHRLEGFLTKEDLVAVLEELGLSCILWEEHDRLLKEFVGRLILAGRSLPETLGCGGRLEGGRINRKGIGYFLLAARKQGDS
jgi:SAM-dependent methyltransferase